MEIESLETEVALAESGAAAVTIHNLCRALESAREKLPKDSPEHAVANFQIQMAQARFQSLALSSPYHTGGRVATVELRPAEQVGTAEPRGNRDE